MEFAASNPHAPIMGTGELPGRTNYLLGKDPARWRLNIPNYRRVLYEKLYPGIDLEFYGNSTQLEFDFIVAPGADPGSIALQFPRANRTVLDEQGGLRISVGDEWIILHKPVVYQVIDSRERRIDGRFRIRGRGKVGFQLAAYDRNRTLTIDPAVSPILSYSTYLGGSQDDVATALVVDSSGNAFVTGYSDSTDFPVLAGAQMAAKGAYDAFLSKLNSTGTSLMYSTYLGGSKDDHAEAIAVDSAGDAYIAGDTASADFPVVSPLGSCGRGNSDAFVAKLSPDGSKLLFATCLGGSQPDHGLGIAVDSSKNMYVVGDTSSSDFPVTTGAYQATYGGGTDAFLAVIKADGSSLSYSSFLGGASDDHARAIALDSSGNAVLAGNTTSSNFPVSAGALQKTFGGSGSLNIGDAFIAKLKPAGGGAADLLYSTYLGGAADDAATSLAVDASGKVYVTGLTFSTRFPLLNPFQAGLAGGNDAFVTKLDPTASGSASLVFSTYLGGNGNDQGTGIAVDSAGDVYVSGVTASTDFPIAGAFQPANASVGGLDEDAFYAKLAPSGNALIHSSYLGGSGTDVGRAIAIDSSRNAYVVGNTTSIDFPVTTGAFETAYGGAGLDGFGDAFLTKILPSPTVMPSPASLSFSTVDAGSSSGPQPVTITNAGDASLSITNIVASGPFSQSNTCQSALAVGANCSVNVVFSPNGVGAAAGTLSLTDNAGGSPQVLPLSGSAVGFAISASSTVAQITAGQPANYSLTITPNGFSGPVSLTCSGEPAASTCKASPSSVTLDGSTAVTVTVTVTTTAKSSLLPAAPFRLPPPLGPSGVLYFALVAIFLSAWFLKFARRKPLRLSFLKLALVLLLISAAAGCTVSGSSSSNPGTAPGTYTIQVTANSGGYAAGLNLTLTVQ